jgi:protein TonB
MPKNGDDNVLVEGNISVSYTRYFDEKTMNTTEPDYHSYFLYNKNRQIVRKVNINTQRRWVRTMFVYLYQNNRLTSALEYEHSYNDKEKDDVLFILDTTSLEPENLRTKIKYIYDSLNQKITGAIYIKEDGFRTGQSYTYDDQGKIRTVSEKTNKDITYEYEYNQYNNWITKLKVERGEIQAGEHECRKFMRLMLLEEEDTVAEEEATTDIEEEEDSDQIFMIVETMPEFPGGQAEMMSFIFENLKYPDAAKENGPQGRVTCSFVVNKDGTIVDAEVVRGIEASLDKEAIRVINAMPKWKPGLQRGKPVRVKYNLSVNFRLQN